MIRCRRKCLIEPDCSEHLMAIRLVVVTDIEVNTRLVIYWYVGIVAEDSGVERSVGRLWRCGTRMEKGKAECENSPTLNDQDVREMLGKVVCNGEYDENVVKDRVKRIDVYEKRLIICYAEKEGYQICEFE